MLKGNLGSDHRYILCESSGSAAADAFVAQGGE